MSQTKNAIFIAATGQNVGKTTLSLGIISALQKIYPRVGFVKPIGQQSVKVAEKIEVDKDAVLFKEHFNLNQTYPSLSPVILPKGFTKAFLDGKQDTAILEKKIEESFASVLSAHDFVVVEGTGHIGVGSIVGLNNARVAALLGLDMIIIAPGGLGSAVDEIALNVEMCKRYGVNVRGVILNRVDPQKIEMIEHYIPKALASLNIPLISCIPYNTLLGRPTVQDFELLFDTKLLSGHTHHCRHFSRNRLVAGSLDSYYEDVVPGELIITPACREDIIFALLSLHRTKKIQEGTDQGWGMILTGMSPPSEAILDEIKSHDLPTLYAPVCSYDAMKKITSFVAKIRIEDKEKVQQAIQLVTKYLDIDTLCQTQIMKI
ncbi:MAG: AAA family ATPase [Chlamydiales bacterium]